MPQDPVTQDRRRQARLAPLREERRRCLRQAAVELASERGYAGISLGMVAVYAGLSRAQAGALYARVSDLLADAIGAHLRALAQAVEAFAVARGLDAWDLAPLQFRPLVLEQLAAMLLLALTDTIDAQRLCRSACGLTAAQARSVAASQRELHMSLAGVLMGCLPGLVTAPEAALSLAQRFLCLLEQAAEDDIRLHALPAGTAQSAALAAAVIAMAPLLPVVSAADAGANPNTGEAEAEDSPATAVPPMPIPAIAAPDTIGRVIAYSIPNRDETADLDAITVPPASVVDSCRRPAAMAAADTG